MTKKKDLFGDELPETDPENFEELLRAAENAGPVKRRTGDSFRGEILSISKEVAFVSTGSAMDGLVPIQELKDDKGQLKHKVGDYIDVVVGKVTGDQIRLNVKNSRTTMSDFESLEDAMDLERPVEGRVLEAVKGGFRIQIQSHRAFCPISQIDISFVKEVEPYVGKKFEFLVTKMDEGHRNIVVSRRKLLELSRAENEGKFLETVKSGDIVEGRVTRVESYGAFVELQPGIEGLIHVSELGWSRVKHANEVVQVGTPVRVKILKLDDEGDRLTISLSLKQGGGETDPWFQVANQFPVGTIVLGTVDKKENFGLFVRLAPGITGLMPKSKWKESADSSKYENKRKGETLHVRVDEINFEGHKITLGLPEEGDDGSWRAHTGGSSGFGTMAALFQQVKPKK